LTAQHNTYPGVSVPHSEWCTPQAKTPTDGAWPYCRHVQTVPAPHRYSGVVPVAHRHRVSLARDIPQIAPVDAFVMVSPGFSAGRPRGMPWAAGPERYYFRMRP